MLRNLRNSKTYVLHQCGANDVYDDLPADAVGAPVFEVPAAGWSTGGTVPIAFLGELGVGHKAAVIDHSYVTAACTQKLVACGGIEAMASAHANWTQDIAASASAVHFTDNWNTGATSSAIDVAFDASSDPGPLARAEWVKFVAAFFNLEAHANRVFAEIQEHYQATEALAAAAVANGTAAPKTMWVSFSSGYTWGGTTYPDSWKISTAAYKTGLVTAAGGASLDPSTDIDAGCSASTDGYTCTAAGMKATMKNAAVVIDETYSYNSNYAISNFQASFNISDAEIASGEWPALATLLRHNILRRMQKRRQTTKRISMLRI